MKNKLNISISRRGFSLAEILAAMIIGSMVLIAVLTIYSRAEQTANALTEKLTDSRLPSEVLQLIAEDIDKVISTNGETEVLVANRYINSYMGGAFSINTKYKDSSDKDKIYEEIIWQSSPNYDGDANDMVLYRSYSGIAPEDKLLDKDKEDSEKDAYVPICRGLTFFSIAAISPDGKEELIWMRSIPQGIKITISFAKPFKNPDGIYDVPENEKYSRIIAIDKSRDIIFDIPGSSKKKGLF